MSVYPPGPCTANLGSIGPSPEELQHKYRLPSLGGDREPRSSGFFGVIPGGYRGDNCIFGTVRTRAITPNRDPDSGTFIQVLPHNFKVQPSKKYLIHGSRASTPRDHAQQIWSE